MVWLKNQRSLNRKGGKFSCKWLVPYVVENISKKDLCTLLNQSGVDLSKKYNVAFLKPYLDPLNPADDKNEDVPLPQDSDLQNSDLINLEGVLPKDSTSWAHR